MKFPITLPLSQSPALGSELLYISPDFFHAQHQENLFSLGL